MTLVITSLTAAKRHKRNFDAVISIEDPRTRPTERLRFTRRPAPDHLVLRFEDLDEGPDHLSLPRPADAEAILTFGRKHRAARLLCHCVAGIGRSGAAGLAILADRLGPGQEADALAQLLAIRPEAVPNLALTQAADQALCREGRLTAAVLAENARRGDWQGLRARKARLLQEQPHRFH
ncbi:hypothetical protein [Microvirga massiliensis]|uniref:hypothetical protein n=1 Tax=Microvirga massiliensis TaxID=1033741 RepID=UPI000660FCD9|nr:hypothetical protein [Microvirga massiliensis]